MSIREGSGGIGRGCFRIPPFGIGLRLGTLIVVFVGAQSGVLLADPLGDDVLAKYNPFAQLGQVQEITVVPGPQGGKVPSKDERVRARKAVEVYRLALAFEQEPRDLEQARELFERAASMGDGDALYRAGFYAENGLGGPVDADASRSYYERAAEAGCADAYAALAKFYTKGQLVAPNAERAQHFIDGGVAAGSIEALYLKGAFLVDSGGDLRQGLGYLRRAAAGGSAGAQRLIGILYKEGRALPQDNASAIEWAETAAESGSPGAHVDLADLLLAHARDSASIGKAADSLLDAEQLKSGRAALKLAFLATKRGPPKPEILEEVITHATNAFNLGQPQAAFMLVIAYERLRNQSAAQEWMVKGAKANDWRCLYTKNLFASGLSLRDSVRMVAKAKYEDYVSGLSAKHGSAGNMPPKPIVMKQPKFPAGLFALGVKGTVNATFVVTPEGKVEKIVISEATHPQLEVAAREAIAQWVFEPALKNGKAVACRLSIPIQFTSEP